MNIKQVLSDTPMAFSSVSNHLDITLPENIKAIFKIKSEFGEIFTNFDIKFDDLNETNSNNYKDEDNYKIDVKNWKAGKVNGGGPEIVFTTLNGNIYVRKN